MSEVIIPIDNYDGKEYIFFPACAYKGNSFKSLKKMYPPKFSEEEAGVDIPVTITDVPRLNEDGSGAIEVTTGDVSVPCMGMFSKERKKGLLIFTVQEINGENLGLTYSEGKFIISNPSNRKRKYVWPFMVDNTEYCPEKVAAETESIEYKVLDFDCEDITEFYDVFFKNRKIMKMDATRPVNLSEAEQWSIQRKKWNSVNYDAIWGYNISASHEKNAFGWCNAGHSYALMILGDETEWKRGMETLEFMFNTQVESGFLPGTVRRDGTSYGYGTEDSSRWLLVRKAGDCLYLMFKHFDLFKERGIEIPDKFIQGAKRLADAFVGLWEKYGQLGQVIDHMTGEIIVGGSDCGAIVPAGLAKAYEFFADGKYLTAAKEIAERYYLCDALSGYTTGGPAEILQCPDSESAFALLESMVILYEVTKEKKWCDYAEYMAKFFSSWVVSYNYRFPEGTEFNKHQIKTVGTVFANVQNKHSAPGICTFSGDSIYKLYKFTGNEAYLELILVIKNAISQCMSTEERPIYSWEIPADPTRNVDADKSWKPEKLPSGTICERVNMSDWETKWCVGGVFNGGCWCEISNLLTLAELPDKLFDKHTN